MHAKIATDLPRHRVFVYNNRQKFTDYPFARLNNSLRTHNDTYCAVREFMKSNTSVVEAPPSSKAPRTLSSWINLRWFFPHSEINCPHTHLQTCYDS
ncbi:hypothetical protein SCLCIDRAFT_921344 [Scleroderma citrinum Foug A]|uniref:Uncharacterized protein n=1 Tax=Scleroderma citrinum Foug A TaxID=1036808 RepID=A0A0C2ZHB3_9AGAM|nr:hypothetical protein SCLCIDRAFT_921344 [Scleroderma citrinum Foug A]